jgi:hypothetical protein
MQKRSVPEASFKPGTGLALKHRDIHSGIDEIVSGRKSCQAGADNDDTHTNP